jgi:hypothetical protein
MPETTKNTVISRPSCDQLRSNETFSQGKIGATIRWKKCEQPWASDTTPTMRASSRREGAVAADIGAA